MTFFKTGMCGVWTTKDGPPSGGVRNVLMQHLHAPYSGKTQSLLVSEIGLSRANVLCVVKLMVGVHDGWEDVIGSQRTLHKRTHHPISSVVALHPTTD